MSTHSEAITLSLHEASPQHLVDEMSDDVVLELGWGRLIFGQTFADADKLAAVLQQEEHGRRDICIYARESHVLVAKSPAELFIDPSHTYRWRFTDDGAGEPAPVGFSVRPLRERAEADAMNRVYVGCGMVPAPTEVIWNNHLHADTVCYLVAVRDDAFEIAQGLPNGRAALFLQRLQREDDILRGQWRTVVKARFRPQFETDAALVRRGGDGLRDQRIERVALVQARGQQAVVDDLHAIRRVAGQDEGIERQVPLMTISTGAVSARMHAFADIREITELAAEDRRSGGQTAIEDFDTEW